MMNNKNLIAKGDSTEIYKFDDNKIEKVFEENFPKSLVLCEALNHASVEETGLSIPKLFEVSKIENRWTITREYIEGKTLSQIMDEDPDNRDLYIIQMVELQLEINDKKCPLLNKLKDRLHEQINNLVCIDDTRKYELLTRLDSMPKHTKLCHGNFSPNNILISEKNSYIIDWMDATQGNASADVAKTYLLLALKDKALAELYIDTFCRMTSTSKKYVYDWLPIVAAAQLNQNVPDEKNLLMTWIDVVDYE